MKLYDSLFQSLSGLLENRSPLLLPLSSPWPEGDVNQLIFRSDAAYELGGGKQNGIAGLLIASDASLVSSDEVYLLGDDLKNLKTDTSYARIALIRVNDAQMGEGKEVYSSIRKIDYVRYHVSVDGVMFRISPLAQKESAIVSKKAVKQGISFAAIGRNFINKFHELPSVEAVKILFITDPSFPYKELEAIIQKGEDITRALDHLLGKVKMDCHSCALQKVCEEVETLCEEEFHKGKLEAKE